MENQSILFVNIRDVTENCPLVTILDKENKIREKLTLDFLSHDFKTDKHIK